MTGGTPDPTPVRPKSFEDADFRRKQYLGVNTTKLEDGKVKNGKENRTPESESTKTPASSRSSLSCSTLRLGSPGDSADNRHAERVDSEKDEVPVSKKDEPKMTNDRPTSSASDLGPHTVKSENTAPPKVLRFRIHVIQIDLSTSESTVDVACWIL